MSLVIGIDVGTTMLCALVLDTGSGATRSVHTLPNSSTVAGLAAGHHEQDPRLILHLVERLVDAQVAELEKEGLLQMVSGVAVTGQMHGVVLVDGATFSTVTNLITWRDRRSEGAYWQPILDGIDSPAKRGCSLQSGYGLVTLAELYRQSPELAARSRRGEIRAIGIADYIVMELSKTLTTDVTIAASWGGFDVVDKSWDSSVLQQLGVPVEVLPPVADPATPLTELAQRYLMRWRLQGSVTVCSGIGDNQASVLSSGSIRQGTCVVNVGTGGQVSIVRQGFDRRDGLETRPLLGDWYLIVGSSLCSGWSYRYLADLLGEIATTLTGVNCTIDDIFDAMNTSGADAPLDAAGLKVDPSFIGSRERDVASGSILQIDDQNLTLSNLVRAFANGIVDELFDYYEESGVAATDLRISGNGVRENGLIREAIADRWQMSPVLAEHAEEAARGVATLAAVNLGLTDRADLFPVSESRL